MRRRVIDPLRVPAKQNTHNLPRTGLRRTNDNNESATTKESAGEKKSADTSTRGHPMTRGETAADRNTKKKEGNRKVHAVL